MDNAVWKAIMFVHCYSLDYATYSRVQTSIPDKTANEFNLLTIHDFGLQCSSKKNCLFILHV